MLLGLSSQFTTPIWTLLQELLYLDKTCCLISHILQLDGIKCKHQLSINYENATENMKHVNHDYVIENRFSMFVVQWWNSTAISQGNTFLLSSFQISNKWSEVAAFVLTSYWNSFFIDESYY